VSCQSSLHLDSRGGGAYFVDDVDEICCACRYFEFVLIGTARGPKTSRFGNGPTKTVIVAHQLHLSRLT
jgi:hypothetical protein